jgi:hypothetical protein
MLGKLGAVLWLAALVSAAAAATPAQAVTVTTPSRIVVQGTVMSGGHVVAGAHVTLYAWPQQAVMAALKIGDRVPLTVVGAAMSSGSGRYAVAVTNWAGVRASADHGIVNLEAMAFDQGRGGAYSFPRQIVATAHGSALAAENQATVPRLAAQRATLRLGPAVSGSDIPCGQTVLLKSYGKRNTIVGVEYSSVSPTVKLVFTYGKDQSSILGVGQSATGTFGSFSQHGTNSVSSAGSENYKVRTKSHLYLTEFTYKLFAVSCLRDQTEATQWDAGATSDNVGNPTGIPSANCVSQESGSKFTKKTTTAWTFSGGADLSAVIGIDLSTQTGYATTASVGFGFHANHALCGTNGTPGSSTPRRLMARASVSG